MSDVPTNWSVPLAYVTFDNSAAARGVSGLPYNALMVGQKLTTGTATENVPVLVTSADDAKTKFGAGSMLHTMTKYFKKQTLNIPLYVIPLLDDDTGTIATYTVTFTGTATSAGVYNVYVAGKQYGVNVAEGDTAADVGDALVTEITNDTDAIVTAANTTGTVTLSTKNKGTVMNDIDIRVGYFAADSNNEPAGLTTAVAGNDDGTGTADIDAAITAMSEDWYQIIVDPYTDSSSMLSIESEMESRWNALRGIGGEVITTYVDDTLSAYNTYIETRNSPFTSIAVAEGIPCAPWNLAADIGGITAQVGQNDPAAPLQFRTLNHKPPLTEDQFIKAERNILLNNGYSTLVRTSTGALAIEFLRTAYTENDAGSADDSYQEVNTILSLIYVGWTIANEFGKYYEYKLGVDSAGYNGNQKVMTTNLAKSLLNGLHTSWVSGAIVEPTGDFEEGLSVEKDGNRLAVKVTPNFINRFRLADTIVQFLN